MPTVTVNIFEEGKDPVKREVEGEVYQDVVTALIRSGLDSGRITGLDESVVDYREPITLSEVNYTIPSGTNNRYPSFRDLNGKRYAWNYKATSTFRDFYNQAVADGFGLNTIFMIAGVIVDLDSPVARYNLMQLNTIFITSLNRTEDSTPTTEPVPVPAPLPTNTIRIAVPWQGEVTLEIDSRTSVEEIIRRIGDQYQYYMLVKINSLFGPYTYHDAATIPIIRPNDQFYLIPGWQEVLGTYCELAPLSNSLELQ